MHLSRRIVLAVLGALIAAASADAQPDSAFFRKTFAGYDGLFLMYNEANGATTVWNAPEARVRYSPCSTFKIFNSMAAIDAGAVNDARDTIRWNGKPYPIKQWDRDHDLRSAIKYSVVWYYQELARRIGAERMQRYLNETDYGNRDMSGGLTRFWLVSSLKISAEEQIAFMRKIPHYRLPFSKRAVDILRDILILEQTHVYTLRGKTGSGDFDDTAGQGWFVGWVERGGNRFYFAVHITGRSNADGLHAKAIALTLLHEYKLIDG